MERKAIVSSEAEFEQWLRLALDFERKKAWEAVLQPGARAQDGRKQAATHQGEASDGKS